MDTSASVFVASCIQRLQAGDVSARDELLEGVADRFRQLCHQMLRDYPRLRRWEETGDIFSSSMLRLSHALEKVTPESPRHFYRLAALQIRRELRDLARRHFGPRGIATHHDSAASRPEQQADRFEAADETHDPQRLHAWVELHQAVEDLPGRERETFELIWYHRLTQEEVAAILGVSRRTVIRDWQSACLHLHDRVGELLT